MLAKLPKDIVELAVWATIYEADRRGQDFGKVRNAYIEVCDMMDVELCRYQLSSEFAGKTTVHVASFFKQPDGAWEFQAIGSASGAGLGEVIEAYLS